MLPYGPCSIPAEGSTVGQAMRNLKAHVAEPHLQIRKPGHCKVDIATSHLAMDLW